MAHRDAGGANNNQSPKNENTDGRRGRAQVERKVQKVKRHEGQGGKVGSCVKDVRCVGENKPVFVGGLAGVV